VNFLYDDIVHALQNTIDSCINSARDRRGYVLERRFTKVIEITQCNGHYAVQGHSRSPILSFISTRQQLRNIIKKCRPVYISGKIITLENNLQRWQILTQQYKCFAMGALWKGALGL